mgnify:CR=1 FL=1
MKEELYELWQTFGPPAWWAATGGTVLHFGGLSMLADGFGWLLGLVAGDGRLWIALASLASSSTSQVPWLTQRRATIILVSVAALVIVAKLYTARKSTDD